MYVTSQLIIIFLIFEENMGEQGKRANKQMRKLTTHIFFLGRLDGGLALPVSARSSGSC